MFVAYLIPPLEDAHLMLEDGLQWIAHGETKEEAEANLRRDFAKILREYESQTDEDIEKIWKMNALYFYEAK